MSTKKTIIVVAHPNLKNSKANKGWLDNLSKFDNNIKIHNLYDLYPDYKINVENEQKLLEQFDNIIYQFPIYWFNCPSLLKEWFDKVYTYGWAYGSTGKKLVNKNIGFAVSLGAPSDFYQNENSLDKILKPFIASCGFVQANFKGIHAIYDIGVEFNDTNIIVDSAKQYLEFINKM